MAGEELTRFPITPEERHRTAKSSDDIAAVPDEQQPGKVEARPQDKPVTPRGADDRPEVDATDEDQPHDVRDDPDGSG